MFLHLELTLTHFALSEAILGEERMDALATASAPLQSMVGRFFQTAGGTDPEASSVIKGSGCYWRKKHVCTYELANCCPQGCEGNGGLWLDGSGSPAKDAPAAVPLSCVSGQGGCTTTDCGMGQAGEL